MWFVLLFVIVMIWDLRICGEFRAEERGAAREQMRDAMHDSAG